MYVPLGSHLNTFYLRYRYSEVFEFVHNLNLHALICQEMDPTMEFYLPSN